MKESKVANARWRPHPATRCGWTPKIRVSGFVTCQNSMMASSPERYLAAVHSQQAGAKVKVHNSSLLLFFRIINHIFTANLKLLTTAFLIILSYLSMSFLTKFFRPFSSMSNSPATPMAIPSGAQTATVAAGCFWGVEHMYRREYKGKGLYDARVGYIGGDSENPGYRAVCSGRTGRTYSLTGGCTDVSLVGGS
jgi:hypothetical protein